ncbi:9071_t:CDS:2 [Paraglomus brasilianum]|uniref:9071_t:CDS:1 n=1 Tax=Paraglomus brasilianum TaxID=144538 RepID=A0A9N8YZS9_9GLOM|nr:9071_t:CDS:2 [Paraglomus brasilianum]
MNTPVFKPASTTFPNVGTVTKPGTNPNDGPAGIEQQRLTGSSLSLCGL